MYETITKAAQDNGFAAVYFLKPLPLVRWGEKAAAQNTLCGMDWNVPQAYAWAKSILLLARAYAPYSNAPRVLPYYIAENAAYFECKALCNKLSAGGARFENAWLPARALALENGVGAQGRNGLLSLDGFGSRVTLFTIATDAVEPLTYKESAPCPDGCDLCAHACPTGAISAAGLDVKKCLRYHMNDAFHPPFVLEKLSSYMGCDECQRACAKNACIQAVPCPGEVDQAFDTKSLLLGDTSAARALVGRNMTGGGKLTVEAIAFAAREHLFENEIRAALASPFEAVRHTAQWALERYF